MPAYNPPTRGVEWIGYISVQDAANPSRLRVNPTLAAGDFQISKDGGSFANFTTLPTVTPSGGTAIKFTISATEMTADNVHLRWKDQTDPPEWVDGAITLQPVAAS